MRSLSEVLDDKSMERDCYKGLFTARSKQEKAHEGRKKITIDGHESVIHIKLSDQKFEREDVEMKVQLNLLLELLQEGEEEKRCRCILRKELKWPDDARVFITLGNPHQPKRSLC